MKDRNALELKESAKQKIVNEIRTRELSSKSKLHAKHYKIKTESTAHFFKAAHKPDNLQEIQDRAASIPSSSPQTQEEIQQWEREDRRQSIREAKLLIEENKNSSLLRKMSP